MSEIQVNDLAAHMLPFFARYLEGQSIEELSGQESGAVQGGKILSFAALAVTKVYPSDREDLDVAVTQAYPSDSDAVSS